MNPILARDFAGFAARPAYFTLRGATAGLMLLALIIVAISTSRGNDDDVGQFIFWFTVSTLLILVTLVAPGLTAHVIVEERANQKLDVLRSAPLSAFGIVFGKWFSRALLLLTISVTALSFAAISLLFGGVPFVLFFGAALIIFGTVLWTTAVGVLASAIARDLTRATLSAYAMVLIEVLVLPMVFSLAVALIGQTQRQAIPPPALQAMAVIAMAVNPMLAMMGMVNPIPGLWGSVGPFGAPLVYLGGSIAMAGVALFLATMATAREARAFGKRPPKVKKAAADGSAFAPGSPVVGAAFDGGETAESAPSRRELVLAVWREHPPANRVWTRPLEWLEGRAASARRRKLLVVLFWVFIGLTELVFWVTLVATLASGPGSRFELRAMHGTATATIFGVLLLFAVASGATIFHRDHEAQTRDVLFASPVDSFAMARAKLACIWRSLRPYMLLLFIHALAIPLTSDISAVGVLLMLLGVYIVTAGWMTIAAWIGIRAPSAGKAIVRAFVVFVAAVAIFPLLTMMCMFRSSSDDVAYFLLGYHPFFLVMFPLFEFSSSGGRPESEAIFLLLWAIAYALFAWRGHVGFLPSRYAAMREDVVR